VRLPAGGGFVAALAVYVVLSTAMAPIVPLSDALCTAAARREGFDYGRVRAWGSISFILAALLGGQAVARLGAEAAIGLIAAGMAATALAATRLPREAAPRRAGAAWPASRRPSASPPSGCCWCSPR
jgi:PPP family 3-phenylpropionic acid transporter